MRKRIGLALVLFVAVAAVAAWRMRVHRLGRIGSGYAAEQTCACLFVSGRTLASCRTDLDPLALRLVSIAPGEHEVRTTTLGIFRARAVYDARYGCSLVE